MRKDIIEEAINFGFDKCKEFGDITKPERENFINYCLSKLNIKLPSDEEINQEFPLGDTKFARHNYNLGCIDGAKWMRDQLLSEKNNDNNPFIGHISGFETVKGDSINTGGLGYKAFNQTTGSHNTFISKEPYSEKCWNCGEQGFEVKNGKWICRAQRDVGFCENKNT